MSTFDSVFETELPGSTDICLSGIIFRHCKCGTLGRTCLIESQFLVRQTETMPRIERLIKIITDILSKTERETAVTCYYTNSSGNIDTEPSEEYHLVDIDSIHLPTNHLEKIDSALINLYRIFGDGTIHTSFPSYLLAIYSNSSYTGEAIINSLIDFGYLSPIRDKPKNYVIAKDGWKRIYAIEKQQTDRTGFIAIAFKDTEQIVDALKNGISNAGYNPIFIKDVEHNNQIVPEIRRYIERCSFLVMDCTYPNLGAYYESGIAVGLGKEVIICCRKDSFESDKSRPHFDIAQQSMIVWENEGDLVNRLVKRIEATVKTH